MNTFWTVVPAVGGVLLLGGWILGRFNARLGMLVNAGGVLSAMLLIVVWFGAIAVRAAEMGTVPWIALAGVLATLSLLMLVFGVLATGGAIVIEARRRGSPDSAS